MEIQDANNSASDESVHADSEAELAIEAHATEDTSTDDTTDLEEQDNPEDDGEDVEYEGKQYRLPKELKAALLRHSDYTRKTQELSNDRQQLAAERQAHAERQQLHEALFEDRATVKNLENYIRHNYENADWDRVEDENPELAQREWRRYQQLQQQLTAARTELQTKEHRLKEQHAQERAQALQETGQTLAREIPNFTRELAQKIVDTGVQHYGFKAEDILAEPDARAWKLLHDAHQWRQHQAKQNTGERQAKQAMTAPLKVVGAKSPPPSPTSDRSDIKTWMEARNKQVRKG